MTTPNRVSRFAACMLHAHGRNEQIQSPRITPWKFYKETHPIDGYEMAVASCPTQHSPNTCLLYTSPSPRD